jgi:hypothetical protein
MNTYDEPQTFKRRLLLQIKDEARDCWWTLSIADVHADNEAAGRANLEARRDNWQANGYFPPTSEWRIVQG